MTIAPADPASADPASASRAPDDAPGTALLRTLMELTADLPDTDPGRVAAAALRGRHAGSDEAELRGLGEEPAGLVRLGAFQSAVRSLAVPAVRQLAEAYPHLEVEVLELEPHASMPALRGGEVDVIVTTTDFVELPLGSDVDIVPLATDSVVLLLPPEHPAAGRGPVDLAAFADEPWAFDVPGSYLATLATRLCRQAGFEPRVVCRFSSVMLLLQHVEAGLSIALLPSLAVDARYRVAVRPLAAPVTRSITAAVRRGSPPRAAVTTVLEALRQVGGDLS